MSYQNRKRTVSQIQLSYFPGAGVAKPQGHEGWDLAVALQGAGRGAAVTEAVIAPIPNPLVTYGIATPESCFIAIIAILISTTYNNRSQAKYREKWKQTNPSGH